MRLIPRDLGFYDLFDEQAAVVVEGARALEAGLREFDGLRAAAERLRDLEHQGDVINHALTAHLERAFVPPFDRGDVLALASGLDDILDLAEEVADKLVLYQLATPPPGAAAQAALLLAACEALHDAIGRLARPLELRPFPARIHAIEREGDTLVRRLVQALFDGATDVRPVLIGKEIYGGLEDAIDRTDKAGRILGRIGAGYSGPW